MRFYRQCMVETNKRDSRKTCEMAKKRSKTFLSVIQTTNLHRTQPEVCVRYPKLHPTMNIMLEILLPVENMEISVISLPQPRPFSIRMDLGHLGAGTAAFV